MQVQFEAKAYLSTYTTIEDVANGKIMPSITTCGAYYESEGDPMIGTATVTIDLYSKDQIATNKLAVLKAQLHTVRAENQRRENAVLDQISKLQAISFEVSGKASA